MELVEGENLSASARERGGLPPADAWSAALQVAEGLQAIHEVGIVHRDLKTANLMRDRRGVVRVMDFGIAKRHGTTSATVTATGALMGTPEYMSPEQLRGQEVGLPQRPLLAGRRGLRALLGGPPFRGDTPVATIVKQLQDLPDLDRPALPGPLAPRPGPRPREEPGRALRDGRRDAAGPSRRPRGGLGARGPSGRAGRGRLGDTRPVPAAGFPGRPPIFRMADGPGRRSPPSPSTW